VETAPVNGALEKNCLKGLLLETDHAEDNHLSD